MKLSYSLPEASRETGLSVSHLDEAIRAGRIKAKTTKPREKDALRQGKRVILGSVLQAYIEGLEDAE